MASYSDLDTSSESGYESGQESVHESDCDDENKNLEPESDAVTNLVNIGTVTHQR
jgi:hypothetical protein